MAIGDITGTIASLEWDTIYGHSPNITHIAGNIYAIAYRGPDSDGFLQTVSISDNGLTLSNKASLEFDNVNCYAPKIIHIAGNIYAIVYRGPDGDGFLQTVSISDNGLTISNKASLEWDTTSGYDPTIIHIAGNIYAIAYSIWPVGWLKTVSISDDGLTMSTVASYEFDNVNCSQYPDFIHIAGNIYVIVYRGPDNDGWLKTVSISDDGLTMSTVASYEYDINDGHNPNITHIAGDVYAIAYEGPDVDGWIKTVSISDDGLTISTVASYEFVTTPGLPEPGNVEPVIIHIAGNTYGIAYCNVSDDDGWLKTVGIITSEPSAARHRFTGGIPHRALH